MFWYWRLPVATGLSPRARGNEICNGVPGCFFGAIPASAGEHMLGHRGRYELGGYPRERGGTVVRPFGEAGEQGLSPRARGNVALNAPISRVSGAIPASAGERNHPRRPL